MVSSNYVLIVMKLCVGPVTLFGSALSKTMVCHYVIDYLNNILNS